MEDFLGRLEASLQPSINLVLDHTFFRRLAAGQLTKDQVQRFALDYNFYCQCFPQLLGYAAAKIPDDAARMPIIENLWEEHGEGDLARSHRTLYVNFLKSLGLTTEEIAGARPSEATARYIAALLRICNGGDALDVLALVGPGTEYFASKEFELIYKGLKTYPFSAGLDLQYWLMHIDVDDHHFAEMVASIRPYVTTEADQQRLMDVSRKAVELEVYFWDEMDRLIQ